MEGTREQRSTPCTGPHFASLCPQFAERRYGDVLFLLFVSARCDRVACQEYSAFIGKRPVASDIDRRLRRSGSDQSTITSLGAGFYALRVNSDDTGAARLADASAALLVGGVSESPGFAYDVEDDVLR